MSALDKNSESVSHERAVQLFSIHALIFAIVNLILLVVNLRKTPEFLWIKWVLLDWGVGLATHAWLTFGPSSHRRH